MAVMLNLQKSGPALRRAGLLFGAHNHALVPQGDKRMIVQLKHALEGAHVDETGSPTIKFNFSDLADALQRSTISRNIYVEQDDLRWLLDVMVSGHQLLDDYDVNECNLSSWMVVARGVLAAHAIEINAATLSCTYFRLRQHPEIHTSFNKIDHHFVGAVIAVVKELFGLDQDITIEEVRIHSCPCLTV